MKLWDFETGNAVFDFGEAHGDAAITCLDFDTTGRRCLTGGRDGGIKIWNYNNGHCLMTLRNRKCSYICRYDMAIYNVEVSVACSKKKFDSTSLDSM